MDVQISEKALEVVRHISEQKGVGISEVLDNAVEVYRREVFLEETNRAFQSLKNEPEAWREELEERALWDNALDDGVEDE
jgi:hypothetical protein